MRSRKHCGQLAEDVRYWRPPLQVATKLMWTVRVTSLISIKSDQSASRTYNHGSKSRFSWTTSVSHCWYNLSCLELGSNLRSTFNLVQLIRDLIDLGETCSNCSVANNKISNQYIVMKTRNTAVQCLVDIGSVSSVISSTLYLW